MGNRFLFSGVLFQSVLVTLLLSVSFQASMAQSTIVSVCTLTDYDSVGASSVWLNDIPGSPSKKYNFDSSGGILTIYADRTANFTGRVINDTDPNRQWEANIWLINAKTYAQWTALGRQVKYEAATPAVVNANKQDYVFWELDSTRSTLIGVPGSTYDGDTLFLSHRPSNLQFGFQFGIGANARTDDFGMGGWFSHTGAYSGKGDVFVNAECGLPPCDVMITNVVPQCLTDSTFEVMVSFTGTGNQFSLIDNQGSAPLTGLATGTYALGPYTNNTQVIVSVIDSSVILCGDTAAAVTADCTPPPVCDVNVDSISTICLTDSTFEVMVSFSGTGSSFEISDDQGTTALGGLTAGTYNFGTYANNTPVIIYVSDPLFGSVCADTVGPVTKDCSVPPVCDVNVDSISTICLTDSTFEVMVSFSGTGSSFEISDDQGTTALGGLTAGTYNFGTYANNTPVIIYVSDPLFGSVCADTVGPVTKDCSVPPVCDVNVDSISTICLTDSTFEVMVSFSGTGSSFEISDDQGTTALGGLTAGTYNFGTYANNTPVIIYVSDPLFGSVCADTVGPVTKDCSPTPLCDIVIDTAFTDCLTDSSFEAKITFSGSGSSFSLFDDQGTPPLTGLSAGTYSYGNYLNNSNIKLFVEDMSVANCVDSIGGLTADCFSFDTCAVSLDTLFAQCQTDSTFEIVVSFSGIGNNFTIVDDNNIILASGVSPGTYILGSYLNSIDVYITVFNPDFPGCMVMDGPVTQDCTPVPVCDVAIDTLYTNCLTDSTFEIMLTFSGTGNLFQVFDDQGTTSLFGIPAGTYAFGNYPAGTNVMLTITDWAIFNCSVSVDSITDNCSTLIAPANDLPEHAIAIGCSDGVIVGSTMNATSAGIPAGVCSIAPDAPGVWYSMIGNAELVTLSTCSQETNYDTRIQVFEAAETGYVCLVGNDNAPNCAGMGSRVMFSTRQGTEYLIYVNGSAGAMGDFHLNVSCFGANTVAGLNGFSVDGGIVIQWSTFRETEYLGFEVQRSVDGVNFSTIDWMNGKGLTQEITDYVCLDKKVDVNRPYYYRIKTNAPNEEPRYSSVIETILIDTDQMEIGALYPNPSNGVVGLNVRSGVSKLFQWELIDQKGVVLSSGNKRLHAGMESLKFDLHQLPDGIYLMRILIDGRNAQARKLVIQKD